MKSAGVELVPYISKKDKFILMDFFVRLWEGDLKNATDLMNEHVRPSSSITLATKNNRVIGFTNVYPTEPRTLHFHQAAVLKEYRQQEIFKAMLENVLSEAGNMNITADIDIKADHLPAMKRKGFKILEQKGWHYRIKKRRKILGLF